MRRSIVLLTAVVAIAVTRQRHTMRDMLGNFMTTRPEKRRDEAKIMNRIVRLLATTLIGVCMATSLFAADPDPMLCSSPLTT